MLRDALLLIVILFSYISTGTVFLDAFKQKTDFGTKGKIKLEMGQSVTEKMYVYFSQSSCLLVEFTNW